MASLAANILLALRDQTAAPLASVRKRLRGIGDAGDRLNARWQQNSQRMQQSLIAIGGGALLGGTLTSLGNRMTRVFVGSLGAAARFEEQMSKVRAVIGANAQQHAALTAKAEEMGETTSFSATQAAEGMEFLARTGWSTTQILDGMGRVLKTAKANGTDLGTTADIVSNIMSGMGLEIDQLNRATDVLSLTTSSSNVDLREMGEALKEAAPQASKAGISLEQLSALTGILGNVGIKGSKAGTAMKTAILRLAAPTGEARDVMEALGVQVADADGNMRDIVTIIDEMGQALQGMGNVEQISILKSIFGEDAGGSLTKLVDEVANGSLPKLQASLENAAGTADRMAKIMGDNLAGSFKSLGSAAEGLSIKIGQVLTPVFRPLIDKVTSFVREAIAWTKANPDLVRQIAKKTFAIGLLLTAIGIGITVITAIGAGIFLFKTAITTILWPLKLFTIAIKLLSFAMTANPVGVIVVGIGLLIAGLIALVVYWDDVWGAIKKVWNLIVDFVKNPIKGLMDAISWLTGKAFKTTFEAETVGPEDPSASDARPQRTNPLAEVTERGSIPGVAEAVTSARNESDQALLDAAIAGEQTTNNNGGNTTNITINGVQDAEEAVAGIDEVLRRNQQVLNGDFAAQGGG